ncbi:unnamed protein product [Rotaria magnacalcarata]|uniref:RING-type domain-containing protein n=2 Tax=Rotaria magnacalcarata TaxID=392030 RepID=A0A814VX06_9BILA|nr:unnamed protein product [Rotaria magnacalcarata]CAF1530849.1 unnamed protein product [Rotaria magnacalcarata]CAF2134821.1 unnamed protein product [Rotaria magnacalcarata]CAF2151753.1 unnamed protein product [Rotaria magnacalcarata]CAF2239797.1 unnamed protein product [Rotaria magnacalcarata]
MNRSSVRSCIDEHNETTNPNYQQRIVPIPVGYLPSATIITPQQQRSSTVNEQTEFYSNLMYNQNVRPIATAVSRKRPIQDDDLIQEYDQYTNKRIRHDQSKSIELENQPPRATIQHRSLFLYHPRQNWNNLQIQNEISSSFDELLPSLSNYHHLNNTSNHEYESNPTNHFSHCDLHAQHQTNQHLCMFANDTLMIPTQKSTRCNSSMNTNENNICLLSPQSNLTSPLRANFALDSKQQTILRTGNISPAHSDSSTESSSTCSSDEQQLHYYSHHQPSRSYRERENYEQLLDLAEKLSDPNRFDKVDVEQFLSYQYKAITTTTTTAEILSSKQTACVICMSHFKNGQHIRVLPCLHEYHSKCIARWFTMNSSCPICRRDNFLTTC